MFECGTQSKVGSIRRISPKISINKEIKIWARLSVKYSVSCVIRSITRISRETNQRILIGKSFREIIEGYIISRLT